MGSCLSCSNCGYDVTPVQPWSEAQTSESSIKSGYGFRGSTQNGWGPEMNARQLVEKVIKPQTAMQGMGYALMTNKAQPLLLKHMVSHCWHEIYQQFLDALSEAATEGPFWVCFVAQYQNEDGAGPTITQQLGPSLEDGPFSTVLRCVKAQNSSMLAVLTTTANIYERMWCIYEMYVSIVMEIPVEALVYTFAETEPSQLGFVGIGGSGHKTVVTSADFLDVPVNTALARCGNPKSENVSADEKNIRARIEAMPGGYGEIDRRIEFLRAVSYAKRTVDPDVFAQRAGAPEFRQHLNSRQKKALFLDKIEKLYPAWVRLHPGQARDPAWLPFQTAYEVDGENLLWGLSLEELMQEESD